MPRLDRHEVDVIYRMRERLEPLALTESIPHLTDEDLARLEEVQDRIEAEHRRRAVPRSSTGEFHLLSYTGCAIDQLHRHGHPAVELHPALPPRVRAR